ncbi:MAG TPA: type II toxin-antitoxin system prevent-host-death family antitoxin [Terriglobales bacterium]|jgi:prevent-host-death family protein|nr:type II toxin-antitoxin system prevent-host-death family antitoxin [Terriglobales bacterium]
MKTVGAFEAKTHLNKLLERVSKGETIRITRRGVPVARLVPDNQDQKKDLQKIGREIREMRKGIRLNGLTIRELIDEGRRY